MCLEDLLRIVDTGCLRRGLQSLSCFMNDRVGEGLTGHFPKCDESIDCSRKADLEDAPVARSAWRLEIIIEWSVITVRAKQHQDIQPVEWIDEAHGQIDIVLQAVPVVHIEVPEFASDERACQ